MCDASDFAFGAQILYVTFNAKVYETFNVSCVMYVIYYASYIFKDVQINYTKTEKELIAIILALEKFWSYLIRSKVIVHTDNEALRYLMSMKDSKPQLIR